MNTPDDSLRRRAEQRTVPPPHSEAESGTQPANLLRLLHELQVHEIELELQNEELRATRAQLELSHARFQHLYESAPIGYLTIDRHGKISQANRAGVQLLRLEPDNISGKNLFAFTREHHASSLAALLQQTFASGQPQSAEINLYFPEQSERILRIHAVVTPESSECLAMLVDETARKLAEIERERLLNDLNQAQKMESVGQLAGGIAHDYNNMLQAILGNLELIFMELPDESPLRESLKEIQTCATHSAEMTRQLLGFARKQTIHRHSIDFNESIERMLKMLRRLIGENIELVWEPAPGLSPVEMDLFQLDQILVNLCVNSRDAIKGSGRITLKTFLSHLSFADGKITAGTERRPHVTLSVSDTGCGMDQSILTHLFEPFFTTKGQGQGTGLGLASVYGVVKQNEGHVQVTSTPGLGTTFFIHLPCLPPSSDENTAP